MAESDIVQNAIAQLGQSRQDRLSQELGIHFADIDERTIEDFLLFLKAFSDSVHYYRNSVTAPVATWSAFFPYTTSTLSQVANNQDGTTPPHLALLLSFLELYKQPQEVLNRVTGRHLDFFYTRVLRFAKQGAIPDKAHVVITLKPMASPIVISPEQKFFGGKDQSGTELWYVPTRDTVINTSSVVSLRSLFLDHTGHGTVRYAPIADSSDGVGGQLDEANPKWSGFGYNTLPAAEVGFALASPVLRMQEGIRKITVVLTLNNVDDTKLKTSSLEGAFDVFLTGEKSWLGPYTVSPALARSGVMTFTVTVPESEKGVVDYDAAIHGYAYAAQAPVAQIFLNSNRATLGYQDFSGVTLEKAQVSVEVSRVTSLTLESDGGTLDPKKAFLPFGPLPTRGARFLVGNTEALSKRLTEVALTLTWKDAPSNFSTYYQNYGTGNFTNQSFTATVSFQDGGSWEHIQHGVPLFEEGNAAMERTLQFTPGSASHAPHVSQGTKVYALNTSGSRWGRQAAKKFVLNKPIFKAFQQIAPEPREGVIYLSLERDFLHQTYRQKYVENVMKYSKGETSTLVILKEPYTPTIQQLSLAYKASSDEVNLSSTSLEEFSNPDLHFFHIAYFGQMREHGYQRAQFPFLTDTRVSLLPVYNHEGELLIGFQNLMADDSVSVLFQVAEGSADPSLDQEPVNWFVLCDNYWKPFDKSQVVLDTTNQLLTSGIITFVIPKEATTGNTILPANHIWIKATVAKHVTAVSQFVKIIANAVEAEFIDQGNDAAHLLAALPQGSITKLKDGLSSVKSVAQPFASFGGRPIESETVFHARVSERLRHKNRAITGWDYERIILEAFPAVHKVKCLPHAKDGVWLAPGHILIVVIPDLRNHNAKNPLEPKVDAVTLVRIKEYLEPRIGMHVAIHVKNPEYQPIQFDFKVKFYPGFEFNYYSGVLNKELIQFLSPWAFDTNRDIAFGGIVYKSVVLDFVEERSYVDYVTDFKMYTFTHGTRSTLDLNEVQPERPDAILVSADIHIIAEPE